MSQPKPRQRLDMALVEAGLIASRSRAKDLIERGLVQCDGEALTKTSIKIDKDQLARIEVQDHPWVSRAGLKLAGAIELWPDLLSAIPGATCIDLGASTGGFTQVLLHHGAETVVAVDVGSDQLHANLRGHLKIICLEQTNCRDLIREHVPELTSIVVSDLSFISLKLALPATLALCAPGTLLVALIKPQFEAGRERLGKGGVVRDPLVIDDVLDDMKAWLDSIAWPVIHTHPSPVLGPDGNQEWLCLSRKIS